MSQFSIMELRRGFEAVKKNRGCAGVDGITIGRFADDLNGNLKRLQGELAAGSHLPLPLLKILVAKKNGEPRGLCIPVVRDRVALRACLNRIEPILEKEFEECSFAYRKGRSIRKAVLRIKYLYNRGFRWDVEADIFRFVTGPPKVLLNCY